MLDDFGRKIHEIYFKRKNYVIYCVVDERTTDELDRQILVQYADEDQGDLSGKQIALVADIIPLRNKLQSLLLMVKNKLPYYVLIAEAFRLGLEQNPRSPSRLSKVQFRTCKASADLIGAISTSRRRCLMP